MALTDAYMLKMVTSHICITSPSQSPNSLHIQNSHQEVSQYLAKANISHHH